MAKRFASVLMAVLIAAVAVVVGIGSDTVEAAELNGSKYGISEVDGEVEICLDGDGVYVFDLEDGGQLLIVSKTEEVSDPDCVTYGTSHVGCTYEVNYTDIYGDTLWSSTLTADFYYDGTYVWCENGVAHYHLADSGIITYTQNSYSSAKVTTLSTYSIAAKIVVSSLTFNLSQSISCTPDGNTSYAANY